MTSKPSLFVRVCGIAIIVMLSVSPATCQAQPAALDLVLAKGRVVDPETTLRSPTPWIFFGE